MTTGLYFPVKPVVKKEVALFANIDQQKKWTRKYTSLFFKIYTSTAVSCCVFVKWSHCKVASFILIISSLAVNTIITVFSICNGNNVLDHCTDLEDWSVLRTRAIFPSTDPKSSYYCIIMKCAYKLIKHYWITCKEKTAKKKHNKNL